MKIHATLVICVVGGLSAATPARAADSGWLLGAGVGQSHYDLSAADGIFTTGPGTDMTRDENDTAYRLVAGYEFNRFLDVEASYADLGQAALDNQKVPEPDRATEQKATVDAKGLGVDIVGKYPFTEQWSVYARVGAFDGRVHFQYFSGGGFILNSVLDTSATKWKPAYGLGVDWAFDSHWTAQFGWDQYQQLGDSNVTGEYNVRVLSAGIVYRFF
jgi:opacity protein-like surface antigen